MAVAEMVEMVGCGLKSKAEVGVSIEKLDLSRNSIKQEGMAHIDQGNAKVDSQKGYPHAFPLATLAISEIDS